MCVAVQFLVLLVIVVNSDHHNMFETGDSHALRRQAALKAVNFKFRDLHTVMPSRPGDRILYGGAYCLWGSQYGTLSPFRRLELEVTPRFSEILCNPVYI